MFRNRLLMKQFITILTIIPFFLHGQDIQDTSLFTTNFSAAYSLQIPGGDLADRFGVNSTIGGDFFLKFKNNWLLGIEGNFIFGNDLQPEAENILDEITTEDGNIINKEGELGIYYLSERGFFVGLNAGRIFPVKGINPNSGIICKIGAGLLQHKIRIELDKNNIPQLMGDYKKGYDRLTNGFTMNEFIGFLYYGNKRIVNFYAGFEFYQGFTKNRRRINFDTMQQNTSQRLDLLYSFRIGWILPIYRRAPEEFYFK